MVKICGIDKPDNEDSFYSTQPKICLDSAAPGKWLQVFFHAVAKLFAWKGAVLIKD